MSAASQSSLKSPAKDEYLTRECSWNFPSYFSNVSVLQSFRHNLSSRNLSSMPCFTDALPDATQKIMDFTNSSFFEQHEHLPSPAQIMSRECSTNRRHKTVIIDEMHLLVKFGCTVTVTEALNLWMVKRAFSDKVPVPEVFGWRIDEEGVVFIYMELITGQTLENRWESLSPVDKESVRSDLCEIISTLPELERDPNDQYIGSISHGHLLDYVFQTTPKHDPFPTIKDFNDWFAGLYQAWLPISQRVPDPHRKYLPDTGTIKFTHADLHRSNIMVSSTSPCRVIAIVDWEQLGWYPDYWEYCKALYTCWYEDEWRRDFIDKFLRPRTEENYIFMDYTTWMGAV